MWYDRTLVRVRERSFLEILDLSLVLIRERTLTLSLAASAGVVPLALINFWFIDPQSFPRGLWIPLWFMEAPWATLPLTLVLGAMMFGQPLSVGGIARRLILAVPSLMIVHLLLRGSLGLTIALAPVVVGKLGFASEVILLEKAGPLRTLRRCNKLSADRFGEFFMQWLGQLFFGLCFVLCFWMGTGAVLSSLFRREVTWEPPITSDIGDPRFQLGVWIAVSFFAIARFLNYLDQRIRAEGWELRLQLQDAGRDLEREAS